MPMSRVKPRKAQRSIGCDVGPSSLCRIPKDLVGIEVCLFNDGCHQCGGKRNSLGGSMVAGPTVSTNRDTLTVDVSSLQLSLQRNKDVYECLYMYM